jgi:putative NADPH-quinone reductase
MDGHPDPDPRRYCHALAHAYVSGAAESGREARLALISEMDFPWIRSASHFSMPAQDADIKAAQADLAWAEHVVVIFPLWLGTMPSLLRGFLEQVARGGFGASLSGWKPRGRGQSARIIITCDARAGLRHHFDFRSRGLTSPLFDFVGSSPVRWTVLDRVSTSGSPIQNRRLVMVQGLGRRGR